MKILSVLNPLLSDYKISGASMLGINLGVEMANQGHQVDFIANKDVLSNLLRELKCYDRVNILPEPEIKSKGKSIQEIIKYATDQYYERDYDVMHIHLHQMSVLSNICKIVPKDARTVYTQHTSTILGRFSLGYRDYARELSQDVDRKISIVMPSSSMLDIWKEYLETDSGLINVSVINNGVSLDYNYIDNELSREQEGRYIACGRLDPNKGILEIAKVFAKNKLPITIIGDRSKGTLKESESDDRYFNEFMEIVNNNDNIKWVKQVNHDELMSMFKKSKGFISFSRKESSSLVTIEAEINRIPIFYLEENAVNEVIETCNKNFCGVYSMMVSRDELYRKRESSRIEIINKKFEEFDKVVSSSESDNRKLVNFPYDIKECAKNYIKIYENLM